MEVRRVLVRSPWMDKEDDGEQSSFSDRTLKTEDTPESKYQDRIFWQQLFIALDELPPEQTDVFIWPELDALPFAEIAARTGEPVEIGSASCRERVCPFVWI